MIKWQELCVLGANLTSLSLATAKGQEKQQLIMIIFFENFFLLWEFTVSKGAKVFIFRVWLLFWYWPVLNTWNHLYNRGCRRVCAEGSLEYVQPILPRCHAKSLSRHFHFPYTVQAYAKGWETTSRFFYNWAQWYKNLILSPFMLPIKLQMLLLNGVPLMHIIEWFLSHLHYDITGPNVACFLC